MAIGVLDLSIVTDALIDMLADCRDNSPLWDLDGVERFNIEVSGSSPEEVRNLGDCQLSLYLFHVTEDKFQKNASWTPRAQRVAQMSPVRFQPLSLDLYYLLTAFAQGDYRQEQRAMSIALRCFHDHPIIKATTSFPEDLSLTMEVESVDELGKFWQALTISYRMSAIYRVGVTFITPEEMPAGARQVESFVLTADPTALPDSAATLVGTLRTVIYRAPSDSGEPEERRYTLSPATGAPGQRVTLVGGNLKQDGFEQVYLSSGPAFPEQDVTIWKVEEEDVRITLRLPADPGAAPGGTPPAGVYQLRVGSDPGGGEPPIRSNATPFGIAALVQPQASTVISPDGATYTVPGKGFLADHTEVLLGTVQLRKADGALAPGTFEITATETTITFQPPADLPTGRYAVRVRVNDVESDPAVWIRVQ